ncbi:MAG TPA: DinB family protein [Thermoanaerobaculia bacterium]|nr:DinB family protein [Thermoanaerobaculia bacterium]
MSEAIAEAALDALRIRITKVLPEQIRSCLDGLTDEQIWSRPNEQSNSIGNLVLHLTGSLNHYLNRNLGGMEFHRNRGQEFAERTEIPAAELRKRFDEMVRRAEQTLGAMTVARLSDPSPEPKMHRLVIEDLINIAIHLSTHAGQIVWITKMIRGGGVNELWINAHRKLGAWPSSSS